MEEEKVQCLKSVYIIYYDSLSKSKWVSHDYIDSEQHYTNLSGS